MENKFWISARYWVFSIVFFGSISFVLAQTTDNDEERTYVQIKLAQEYAISMNKKLNDAIQKSKSFKEMKANWDLIIKSDPTKVEDMVKKFYSRYSTQIYQAKKAVNYNENEIVGKMSEYFKGLDISISAGNGAFLLAKFPRSTITTVVDLLPKCLDFEVDNFVKGPYTGPPAMGIKSVLLEAGFDFMEIDASGNDFSGNKIIVDTKVSNGQYGQGASKLLKVKVPNEFACADLKINCNLRGTYNYTNLLAIGPSSETLARVKVKRTGLPGNLTHNAELYCFFEPFTFGSLNTAEKPNGYTFENGAFNFRINECIRVRAEDELEILFEAASNVMSYVGGPAGAIGSVENIVVSMCKCK